MEINDPINGLKIIRIPPYKQSKNDCDFCGEPAEYQRVYKCGYSFYASGKTQCVE